MIPTNPIPEVPNYGSSAQYKDLPSPEQIRAGVIPLDSLPAAWWNAMWACTNTAVNEARSAVGTLINEVCNAITGAGICINESCIDQLYQAIDTIRQRIGNAVTAGAVKSSSCGGQITIENDGTMTMNGVGNAANLNTSAKVVVSAINELKSTYDSCISDLNGSISSVNNSKAPTSHVSSATTYGVGNADCYGHLKISDTYNSCVGAAADGVAASQKALYCVYQAVQSATSLGNTAGCALGTASAGTATTAARSDHVHPLPSCVADKYGSSMIGIGYACAGLTCAQLTNLAAFSTSYTSGCTVIKDVSKATVQSWLGLGGAAYCAASCFRASTWTPSCVSCSGCATCARCILNSAGTTAYCIYIS